MAGLPRVQLSLKGRLLSEVAFVGPQLRIGRMRENDVVVNNLAVSRFHAVLKREGDGFVLEDLGSENGTQLNGERITGTVAIQANDVIQLGKYELRLALQPGMQIAGAPKPKASDAWDASQTFLALDPPAAKAAAPSAPAAAEKSPSIAPSPLAPKLAPSPVAVAAPPVDAGADEDLALPMIDVFEDESESEAAAAPDPEGVFAFGEDDVDAVAAGAQPDSQVAIASEPLTTPNPEHTSLFDFGSPAAPEPEPSAEEFAEIPADFGAATPAHGVAAAAPPAMPAAEASKLYAGVIVQRDGKLHLLRAWEEGELCAGRAPECDLVLADAGVSRRHATFTRSSERYSVRDLGSVNGIYVNGQRTKQHDLTVGDVVRIESFELTFVLDHSPISSEVSGPAALPGMPQDMGRTTQFSLEAPAREGEGAFEIEPVATEPTSSAPAISAMAFDDVTDGFEILPPADDPMAGEAQTGAPVLAVDLPESDLISAEGIDDDDEKDATVQGRVGAQVLRTAAQAGRSAVRLRLVIDPAQLSPRAREALAVLEDEGVDVSARISFEGE